MPELRHAEGHLNESAISGCSAEHLEFTHLPLSKHPCEVSVHALCTQEAGHESTLTEHERTQGGRNHLVQQGPTFWLPRATAEELSWAPHTTR